MWWSSLFWESLAFQPRPNFILLLKISRIPVINCRHGILVWPVTFCASANLWHWALKKWNKIKWDERTVWEFFVLNLQAFIILLSNALRVAAINCVGDFVLFLGKLAVVALTAVCGLAIMGVSLSHRILIHKLQTIDLSFVYKHVNQFVLLVF